MGKLSKQYANTVENIRQSIAAIRSTPLRSILTMTIVSIGLTALMGMLTVINAIAYTLQSDLGGKQGSAFRITSWARNMNVNGTRYSSGEDYRYIRIGEGFDFAEAYAPYGDVGLDVWIASIEARRGSYHTRPRMSVRGVNRAYFNVENLKLESGRYFSDYEERSSLPVVIIGENIVQTLFPNSESPLGKRIQLGSMPFTVVGVLAKTSSSFGYEAGDRILVPIKGGLTLFPRPNVNCNIAVKPFPSVGLNEAKDRAEQIMRQVRRLKPSQRSNFNIMSSDEILTIMLNSMSSTAAAGILIGLITLLGSAVALMNIMLASVTERTKEIGVRKAIGAHGRTVRQQFLIEAVFVTVAGGLVGIMLGIAVGALVAAGMSVSFTVPWAWALGSLLLCVCVGIMAGYLPAKRAAALDPILALRYE